jgi:chemotaxis protein CheD
MLDDRIEVPLVYLQPGEIHLALDPLRLRTVLGSCIGVTFWSRKLGAGAVCHAVLPRAPHDVESAVRYRYVDFTIRDLAGQFDQLGARRHEVQVKLFGGADVLPVHASESGRASVGRQNWQSALDILRQEGLSVLACDIGGPIGRTIEFHSGTGEVLLRRLSQRNGDPW